MFIIRKEFSFCAAHKLEHLPEGHPCTQLHGHNYIVTVELRAKRKRDLNEAGFVQDYRGLDPIKKFIDEALDHKYLNDFLPCNPSAELIAEHLYNLWKEQFPKLWAVEVSETPKTVARYDAS
jgi:6-pyruvoyltetrahydropterin/6-carboxytetrahydropterin synthase